MNLSLSHFGILLSNSVNKVCFITKIISGEVKGALSNYKGCKGVLFSDLTIDQIIQKEHKHHTIEISKSANRQLHTFSSGERRKVLLEYCISQSPDFIIVDNPFDHLDQQSRIDLFNQLKELSTSIAIIQLSSREESLLTFITKRGYASSNSFSIADIPDQAQTAQGLVNFDFPSFLLSFEKVYENIVKFDKVCIAYDDKPILTNITWEVKPGEFWQLIGPNGSGKSTLLSLITGENPKAYGQNITIFDRKKGSGESIWELKKKIGHFSTNLTELFQRNHTVENMVLSGFFDSVGLYVKPSSLQRKKTLEWLTVIHMGQYKDKYFNRLPLGQQRLVLIIRALIKQPPLLILDEPFEGLDQENINLMAHLINTLIKETEITVIYVSHTFERSLVPSHVYELIPNKEGSLGRRKA